MNQKDYIHDVAKTFLTCVVDRLTELELPIPCRVCVVPGQIVYDDCQGGQLAVSVTQEYWSSTFPAVDETPRGNGCTPPYLVADYLFSLMRCAPVPKGLNNIVPCAELEASALLIRNDAYALRTALSCCADALVDQGYIVDFLLRPVATSGPEGGCVGNEAVLTVGFAWLG